MPSQLLRRARPDLGQRIRSDPRRAYQIAAAVKINAPMLSGICTGRRNATEDQAERLAEVLGASIDDLFGPPELTDDQLALVAAIVATDLGRRSG